MAEGRAFGYVRVSAKDQHTDRQMMVMDELGLQKRNIFIDKQSGKDFNRPQYKRMIRKLKAGDIIYIKSIDRLGRNYDDIIEQWRLLTHQMNVHIVVIDFPLLDTRKKDKDITGKFIADLVLQILSYVAQVERENIKQRQKEGIIAAHQKGTRFGRPSKQVPSEFKSVYEEWTQQKISGREAARRLSVDYKTFFKWVKKQPE